ncbi:alpha/beta hydrolase [Ideonella sp. DXS29W]|uniref:Alpha/beta hydrolase n=1 Tax=Ideonella lacteola TaxID=2984193 RepID=A0ABU9BVX5_9BURK
MKASVGAALALTLMLGAWPGLRATAAPGGPDVAACATGLYRLADGGSVDLAPAAPAGSLRWRRLDGTTGLLSPAEGPRWRSTLGWTGRDDGVDVDMSECAAGRIRFGGQPGRRVAFDTQDATFGAADGALLAGRLVMPTGPDRAPIVVLIHGSEDTSALERFSLQRLLPAMGVGVFVYDKRGTGRSTGTFTHDLHQLARDAASAINQARRMAGPRATRVGVYGTSQGGWTAPLAARIAPVDFLMVGYGLAVSPFDEDREAIALDMSRHGFSGEDAAKAQEVGVAARAILLSRFDSGYDGLRAVLAKYGREPWLPHVRGNVTHLMINTPEAFLRAEGPRLFHGVIPDHDPMPALQAVPARQLWVLGAEDIDAPYAETYRRLKALRAAGRPVSVVVYRNVEHGLYEFETASSGERLSTRQPASLLGLLAGFARDGTVPSTIAEADVTR